MNPHSRFLSLVLAVVCAAPFTSSFAQNIVTNGNFETGTTAGWTQGGNTANSGIAAQAQNPLTASALNVFGYQSGPVTTGLFSQSLLTVPGTSYDYGFWFRLQNGAPAVNEFRVTLGGQEIFHLVNINPGSSLISSVGFTPYLATNASTLLQFEFRTNGDSHWFLDDVFVTGRTSAVPESATSLGLLALGCVAIGLMRTRISRV